MCMPLRNFLVIILVLYSSYSFEQPFQNAAKDAFLITRMAEKFHVQPRQLNEDFSNNVFNALLKKVDGEKIFLLQEDINQLQEYRFKLSTEITTQKINFLKLLTTLYMQRLQQADTMAATISAKPFNFNLDEKYTSKEDTTYPVNLAAMRLKLYKNFKYSVVSAMAVLLEGIDEPIKQKKIIDTSESLLRKKVYQSFKRDIQKEMQSPGGIAQLVCNYYCKSVASCYDPHSAYMTQTDKENFESGIGKKNMVFGFNLNEDDEGEVTINSLQPGSSAFKSGMMNKGDKIISIQWENAKPIDVSDASAAEIGQMLDADNHAKATLTFLKADGTKRQVTLSKEQSASDDDDEKVKSYLLKGQKTIGYISLPSFYEDWEDKRSLNGCSNDIAKEILKLKKENIDGLILDVRYNGGGSVGEAVDLAGIFIDAGPICQFKTKEPKPVTLKDANRGTIYDGPMALLVNGFSASASELLAGALQDYHRAIIVGSTTFGKATGQRIMPLDTTIDFNENTENTTSNAFIKLTTSQVFQVSGATAQFKGVVPDILLPDATDAYDTKEKSEPFAIPANSIEANKYYLPNKPLPIEMLKEKAAIYQQEDNAFSFIKKYIADKKNKVRKQEVSLKLSDVLKNNLTNQDDDDEPALTASVAQNKFYKVAQNKYETQRIQSDSDLKNSTDNHTILLSNDADVKIAYRLLLLLEK